MIKERNLNLIRYEKVESFAPFITNSDKIEATDIAGHISVCRDIINSPYNAIFNGTRNPPSRYRPVICSHYALLLHQSGFCLFPACSTFLFFFGCSHRTKNLFSLSSIHSSSEKLCVVDGFEGGRQIKVKVRHYIMFTSCGWRIVVAKQRTRRKI